MRESYHYEHKLRGLKRTINNLRDESDRVSHSDATISDSLFYAQRKYEAIIEALSADYPEYHAARYADFAPDRKALQELLGRGRMVLWEQFYDRDSLYHFVVDRKGIQCVVQPFDDQLAHRIQQLRDYAVSDLLRSNQDRYGDHLFALHRYLVEPVAAWIEDYEQVLIVPHGVLSHLSFGTLAPRAAPVDYRSLDYLVRHHAIRYHWSAALWLQQHASYSKTNRTALLAFAPDFALPDAPIALERAALAPLRFAQVEARHAVETMGGYALLGEQATRKTFLEDAITARYVHLATHAVADPDEGGRTQLLFGPESEHVTLSDIYGMRLASDLVVASGCDTGYGPLRAGEGVYSLGRAFVQAGSREVMMSQWLVNDRAGAEVMQAFYPHLADGYTTDAALRSAQLDYLAQADGLTAHPHLWGAMVVWGAGEPPVGGMGYWWVVGIGALLLVGITVFWLRRL